MIILTSLFIAKVLNEKLIFFWFLFTGSQRIIHLLYKKMTLLTVVFALQYIFIFSVFLPKSDHGKPMNSVLTTLPCNNKVLLLYTSTT